MTNPHVAALRAHLQGQPPDHPVRAILRVSLQPDRAAALVEQRGAQVLHRYRLLPALAVQGTASLLLELLDLPWVTSAEEDREVRNWPENNARP